MCGFVGYTNTVGVDGSALLRMMDTIVHRGPDSDGYYTDDGVALGFRRLAIIDLEDGGQPILNEDGTKVIVFNGEIYNHLALREELAAAGHVFKTQADTEVLLHGYEEWGTGLLDRLRGMFAFAIWDTTSGELFLARDYYGIKPLYYSVIGDSFVFASEIKSILEFPDFEKVLNEQALESYLTFQYSSLPETFFKGVFRLPAAHYATVRGTEIKMTRWWEPVFAPEKKPLEQSVDEIDAVFRDSVEAHKIADVEVGSFLSSGVDSSYVAATFNGDKTFTVGFDYGTNYNEITYAKELSELIGIDHYSKTITSDEYWDILPTIQYHMDEPNADPSAVALYFVSQLASEHVKVVLSGEGADELFGGYNIYRQPMDLAPWMRIPAPIRNWFSRWAETTPWRFRGRNLLIRLGKTVEETFIGNANMFSVEERKALLRRDPGAPTPQEVTAPYYAKVKNYDDVTKMQYIDIHTWMWGDILQKADRMSMAHSLELRVPFLDREVTDVALTIPPEHRVTKENTKWAMRLAARRAIPEKWAQKKKLGFPVPTRVWLREEKYRDIVAAAFASPAAERYFHTAILRDMLDEHFEGHADNSRKIWVVYSFLVWYERFFGAGAGA